MSIPYSKILFRAEIRRRLRMKQNFVFFPAVREQIKNLRRSKQRQSKTGPNREFATIIDLDLINAVRTCEVIHEEETLDAPGWIIVINGLSRDGWTLRLHVWLTKKDDNTPLAIMSFALISEEVEGDDSEMRMVVK